jgi:hypothetical protein
MGGRPQGGRPLGGNEVGDEVDWTQCLDPETGEQVGTLSPPSSPQSGGALEARPSWACLALETGSLLCCHLL